MQMHISVPEESALQDDAAEGMEPVGSPVDDEQDAYAAPVEPPPLDVPPPSSLPPTAMEVTPVA